MEIATTVASNFDTTKLAELVREKALFRARACSVPTRREPQGEKPDNMRQRENIRVRVLCGECGGEGGNAKSE